MKRVRLTVHEPSVNRVLSGEVVLQLDDEASLIDAIDRVDRLITAKGVFPNPDYHSLLHMVYNPVENRFYKQVAVAAYTESQNKLNIRVDPRRALPADVIVILIPFGGCISEWEQALDFEEFSRAMQAV